MAFSGLMLNSTNREVRLFLNKTTICDIGNALMSSITVSLSLPIGKYMPVRKPINEPIIVLHADKALLLFNNETGNITIADEHTELMIISRKTVDS